SGRKHHGGMHDDSSCCFGRSCCGRGRTSVPGRNRRVGTACLRRHGRRRRGCGRVRAHRVHVGDVRPRIPRPRGTLPTLGAEVGTPRHIGGRRGAGGGRRLVVRKIGRAHV